MINAAAFKDCMLCAYAALQANVQTINDLNVFPVPDGDTGTNMGLTMERAAQELRKKDFDTVASAADCVASALLRAARGNSGVILSLLFRGISKKLKGLHEADAKTFAAAMQEGVEAAYKAVMKPAEGTILTVSRLASAAAAETAAKDAGLEKTFEAAIRAGDEALADTVNLNPVLKKAGVVDAGGMGYMVILKAMFDSLRGTFVPPEDQIRIEEIAENPVGYDPRENITFAFDTVYIVRKNEPNVDLEPLRAYLGSVGDSLVINEDWRRSRTWSFRPTSRPAGRRRSAPTIWTKSRRSWRPPSRRACRPRSSSARWSSPRATGCSSCSGSSARTASSPAGRP